MPKLLLEVLGYMRSESLTMHPLQPCVLNVVAKNSNPSIEILLLFVILNANGCVLTLISKSFGFTPLSNFICNFFSKLSNHHSPGKSINSLLPSKK